MVSHRKGCLSGLMLPLANPMTICPILRSPGPAQWVLSIWVIATC